MSGPNGSGSPSDFAPAEPNDDMTAEDVLLALVMEALEGGPVDVIQVVTDLGFGDLVELARSGEVGIEDEDSAPDEDAEPALDDPDADELDEDGADDLDDTDALIDALDGEA